MATYDEALFRQKLDQLKRGKEVTLTDIEVAFWHAASDLQGALVDQAPDKLEGSEDYVRAELVPQLARTIEAWGYIVTEYIKAPGKSL